MSKIPYINYNEIREFCTIPEVCTLFHMEKAELKEACDESEVKPRRNEIGQYGLVKYDVCKLHNILYHKGRNQTNSKSVEDDPWA